MFFRFSFLFGIRIRACVVQIVADGRTSRTLRWLSPLPTERSEVRQCVAPTFSTIGSYLHLSPMVEVLLVLTIGSTEHYLQLCSIVVLHCLLLTLVLLNLTMSESVG